MKYINRFFLETISQTGMILCMDDDMMVMSEICDFCADLKSNMAATMEFHLKILDWQKVQRSSCRKLPWFTK